MEATTTSVAAGSPRSTRPRPGRTRRPCPPPAPRWRRRTEQRRTQHPLLRRPPGPPRRLRPTWTVTGRRPRRPRRRPQRRLLAGLALGDRHRPAARRRSCPEPRLPRRRRRPPPGRRFKLLTAAAVWAARSAVDVAAAATAAAVATRACLATSAVASAASPAAREVSAADPAAMRASWAATAAASAAASRGSPASPVGLVGPGELSGSSVHAHPGSRRWPKTGCPVSTSPYDTERNRMHPAHFSEHFCAGRGTYRSVWTSPLAYPATRPPSGSCRAACRSARSPALRSRSTPDW